MDKRTVSAFVIIGVILIAWLVWTSNQQKSRLNEKIKSDTVKTQVDTTKTPVKEAKEKQKVEVTLSSDSLKTDTIRNSFGNNFYKNSIMHNLSNTPVKEKIIMIEGQKAYMEFTNYGGTIRKFVTREFKMYNGDTLQLIEWKKGKEGKELNLLFTSSEGKLINTKDLVFDAKYSEWERVDLSKTNDFKLKYELLVGGDSSQKIIKTYTFKYETYEFTVDYELVNSGKFISRNEYQVVWGTSLNLSEYLSTEEATFSEAYAFMGKDIETYSASKFINEYNEQNESKKYTGTTEYVSTRNKYFGVFIIPLTRKGDGAYLSGYKEHLPDEGVKNNYSIGIKMEIKDEKYEKNSFEILLSPIDYNLLKAYDKNLEQTMRFSLDFIVRPIAQYFIIPFFTFLHKFIPNYGLVIIIFAIALKILLNPLTKKQMQSMKKMGQLNPKMTAIKEKYKDDPTKMNKMIMNLYKEEKINPAGGCLPLLLQLPILYALFGVFRSTIELRQANFIWWIKDLSVPDVVLKLPFKIPIFGINEIAGLATLMGITMFLQQKMTVTDPKQKAMVYMMPVMMTLLFFSFPSGLNLYYFIFNLLSIGQQYYETKIRKPDPEEEKKPVKPGFFEKLMKRSEEIRKSQSKRRR
ncbi:MAG: membrane protein insertase YidC [Ignavibacteriae bacterium]|nr:membrane protein insertase YidC [Ignavibacteriota bacterium]